MPRSSADQPKTAGQINVYWRRRVIALAAGLGLLALVTWTVNGALGGGTARQATNLSQTTSQHSTQRSSPPAAAGSASGTRGSAPASPGGRPGPAGATPSATATPSPSPSATRHPSAKRHPGGRPGRKAMAAGASRACPGAALVLSLSSARPGYPAQAQPEFEVDVVSTAPGRCTADLGSTRLHVVIRAGGKHEVWDSADCASPGPRATALARGVPTVVQIAWNRKISAPGCRAPHRRVRPGTYTATAYRGKLGSRPLTFMLRGRG